jgi:hypothetical protein
VEVRHSRGAPLAQDGPTKSKQLRGPAASARFALAGALDEPAALDESAEILLVQLETR